MCCAVLLAGVAVASPSPMSHLASPSLGARYGIASPDALLPRTVGSARFPPVTGSPLLDRDFNKQLRASQKPYDLSPYQPSAKYARTTTPLSLPARLPFQYRTTMDASSRAKLLNTLVPRALVSEEEGAYCVDFIPGIHVDNAT